MRLKLNNEFFLAGWGLSVPKKILKTHKHLGPLRFKKCDIRKAFRLMNEGKFQELENLAVPPYIPAE